MSTPRPERAASRRDRRTPRRAARLEGARWATDRPATPHRSAPDHRSGPTGAQPRATATATAVLDAVEAPAPTSFEALGVPAAVVAALAAAGAVTPFPVQAATLRSSLAGRDVLGRGRTGSGKTIAFAVPTVVALAASPARSRPGHPRGLILVPTRELAEQVAAVVRPLAACLGQRVVTIYGGVGQGPQVAALDRGVDIIVACPGRLEDLIGQRRCHLDAVEVCVLDEADHLADLGFLPAVTRLLDRTPAAGQRLLFSATLDGGVDTVVRRYLRDPESHAVDAVDASPPLLAHHAFTVEPGDKAAVVHELASGQGRSLLFTRTKHAARKLARQLAADGIPAVDLHGNLSQAQRRRNLAAFAEGSVRVLVATDIAARGIHVDDIGLVVHVDPPAEPKAFLHRSGRTARAGADGVVVTVLLPAQEREVRTLVRQAGIRPTQARVRPGDARTAALTGPVAARRFLPLPPAAPARPAAGGRAEAGGRAARRGRR